MFSSWVFLLISTLRVWFFRWVLFSRAVFLCCRIISEFLLFKISIFSSLRESAWVFLCFENLDRLRMFGLWVFMKSRFS